PTAGVVSTGTPTKPAIWSGWAVLLESFCPMTDKGALPLGPVTAAAVETYDEPARAPSSEGTATNESMPWTGRDGGFRPGREDGVPEGAEGDRDRRVQPVGPLGAGRRGREAHGQRRVERLRHLDVDAARDQVRVHRHAVHHAHRVAGELGRVLRVVLDA